MAYDKVVDSAKLNAAMTATANAIRAKSGGTGKITWDESNGFAGDVNALPEDGGGVDVSGVTSAAPDVLIGKKFVTAAGELEDGAMPNNGAISKTMDGLNTKSVSIPEGYTSGGTVSLTDDIDNISNTQADKIAQIKTALEGKAAGGGGGGTCTVTIVDDSQQITEIYYQDAVGSVVNVIADPMTPAAGNYTCIAGSLLLVDIQMLHLCTITTENIEYAGGGGMYLITAGANETATLTVVFNK